MEDHARLLVDEWIIRYMPAGVSSAVYNALIVGCTIGLRAKRTEEQTP